MYKAKRNMMFGGKGFEKGKEYDLTPDEVKNIGYGFEGVKVEEAVVGAPENEPEPKPKKVKKEESQGEKKAKRR